MPISKKRKLNINKKIKTQKGGARRTIKQTTPLPDVPILPPGLSFPKVPMSDPGLKLANDQCYNASQNIRDLQAKIDQETEELKHKTVSQDISRLIIQGRNAKKMNQKQLAQSMAVQVSVIQDYENGKAIPNNQILGKLERVLGVKLRGKISK